MKIEYNGYEINVERKISLGGEKLLYFSVYRISDGYECVCDFEDSNETVKGKIKELKEVIDYEIKTDNPFEENEYTDETNESKEKDWHKLND